MGLNMFNIDEIKHSIYPQTCTPFELNNLLKLLKNRKTDTKCNKTPAFSWNIIEYYILSLTPGKNLAIVHEVVYKNRNFY